MQILSVSNFFDTHGGGLERVAGHLSREFLYAGHSAAWAACDADGLPDNPATAIGLGCINPTERLTGLPMPLPGPRSIARLKRAVRGADVVVIHDALYVTSVLSMIFAKLHGKPAVLVQHIASIPFANPVLSGLMWLANNLVTRPMMAAADRIAFISAAVRDDLLGSPPRRPAMLVFNGVDRSIFHPRAKSAQRDARARWQLPDDAPLAVFVGRFVEKKGLRVIRALAERRPDIHFALFGQGPIDPREWGLCNVHPLGQQPQDVIADLYRAADVLLLPSVGEGYPLVIQEAMACGLPVACGEASARADPDAAMWLHGIDIDLGDPARSAENCAAALDRLAASPVDRAAMARYAVDRYSWERMAATLLADMPSITR